MERRDIGGAVIKTGAVEPAGSGCAVGACENHGTGQDAVGCSCEGEVGVASEVLEQVERGREPEVGRDLKPPRLTGDKAIAANAVIARVNP